MLEGAALSATDDGAPTAFVATGGAQHNLVVLWPLYRGPIPADTQARRAAAAGWVLGMAPVDGIVGPVASLARGFGATTIVTATASAPGSVAQILGGGVSVSATEVPAPSGLGVLLITVLTLFASLAILGCTAYVRRRALSSRMAQEAREEQARLVADVTVTVQESLDVGVVLPAVLAELSDRLNLTWIHVVTGPVEGGVELLSLGRRPAGLPRPRTSLEASSARAGELVRLPLARGSRTLGRVELIAANDLDDFAMASLRQCADLLAGSLHNAELFERDQELVRRLRDLDALKDDFLATVSHELRTPLSVLVGSVSLLTKSWDRIPDDSRRSAVEKMGPHVSSLTHLVNDLLDFISDRRAAPATSLTAVDLDRQIHDLVDQLRPLVPGHDLQVVADPVVAWTDVRALERIIGNFVGNAGKYSPAGTTIRVEVREAGGDAVVSVVDQGPGIRPEDRERIFERFYRGDSDAARTTRGTGIGLAVALAWMRAVGARLEVRTAVGRGTAMTVHFPSALDHPVERPGTVTWNSVNAEGELVR
jgi:signal transduction histidine kinase